MASDCTSVNNSEELPANDVVAPTEVNSNEVVISCLSEASSPTEVLFRV